MNYSISAVMVTAYLFLGLFVGIVFYLVVPYVIPLPEGSAGMFFLFSIGAGLFLGLLNFAMTKLLLRKALAAMERVFVNVGIGKLDTRLSYKGKDDFARTAGHLNHMIMLLEQAYKEVQRDSLTRLPNRKALEEWYDRAVKQQAEPKVIFIDLNDFKQVNDDLGHYWGDVLLQQVGERMGRMMRHADIHVSRYGGDEFIVAYTDPVKKADIMSDLYTLFHPAFALGEKSYELTFSAGGADTGGLTDMIRKADAQMYVEKQKGKRTDVQHI